MNQILAENKKTELLRKIYDINKALNIFNNPCDTMKLMDGDDGDFKNRVVSALESYKDILKYRVKSINKELSDACR